MTSRRPMTRSFSANGRTSSFSEEDSSSSNGRPETRNNYLSNVRPENSYSRYSHYRPMRSTLCTVMSQLTEDIQPSFETTLKSKAVSENCNAKFTCVVTGYPAPELKWYKDDMEMDRYCGLPKYEIRKNGKIHTLHIYNCTLDDAAIYQVSASNSKGIVSCSGVLEVGTMSEFKIHQRFFAKLKQKAENKKKDLEEHPKKENKKHNQREEPQVNPEPPPRKRPVPPPEPVQATKEQLGAAREVNGVNSSDVKETAHVAHLDNSLEKDIPASEELLAKKKLNITNGVDAGVNTTTNSSESRVQMMVNGGENHYDGGIGLAQFLSETLQTQADEESQTTPQVEQPQQMELLITNTSKEKEERERKQTEKDEHEMTKEKEYFIEREREKEERLQEGSQPAEQPKQPSEVKHHRKAHKDHDHHNIQETFSSMLHTVKDFFFGKGKRDSYEHIENKEKDHDQLPNSIQPESLQSQASPSYRPHRKPQPEVEKPPTDQVVPKQKELSQCADIDQGSQKLMTAHEHEVVQSSALELPTKSTKEPTRRTMKVADEPVENVKVSLEEEIRVLGEDPPLSGLHVSTEEKTSVPGVNPRKHRENMKTPQKEDQTEIQTQYHLNVAEQNTKVVSRVDMVLSPKQEPDSLIASLQPHHPSAREEFTFGKELHVFPQSQTSCDKSFPPKSNLLEVSQAPSPRVILAMEGSDLIPTELLQGGGTHVDEMDKEGGPVKDVDDPPKKLCVKEKTEVKSNELPCSDIKRPQVTESMLRLLKETIETMENQTPNQTLSSFPDTETSNSQSEKVENTSVTQETNVGFPPTAAPAMGDLKMPESTQPLADESKAERSHRLLQSSESGFGKSETGSEKNDKIPDAILKDVENSVNIRKKQELVGELNEVKDKGTEMETDRKPPAEANNVDEEPKIFKVAQNKLDETSVVEKNKVHENSHEKPQSPPERVALASLCIENTTDFKEPVSNVSLNEYFAIPKIDIIEPEVKQFTLPLTILALNKIESEPGILEKHIKPQAIAGNVVDSSLPKQKIVRGDDNPPPTDKADKLEQLEIQPEIAEPEHTSIKAIEQLPQVNLRSIPQINVSCSEDKENHTFMNTCVSDSLPPFETPTVPLFVVPPISVTCHENESELKKPSHSEWIETETSVSMRGTASDMAAKSEKPRENMAEQSFTETTSSMPNEAVVQRVNDKGLPISRNTEDNISPEILKAKPLKEGKIENSMTFEDFFKSRTSGERLTHKPPTHPSLSPGSIRKFMTKAAQDLEIDAGTGVPVITVDDRQSDRTDGDLSGGSTPTSTTPTSSLSCESSPRIKRRDSLSLIRSATPEELASGARRKIFIPKPKEDADIAPGGLEAQNKKETPYMSPSQARRAALLQAPVGQNTPPMERRSPLMSRRKATLEVPKVVEEPPKDEPVKAVKEEKVAEKKYDPLKAPQIIRKIRGEPFPDASGHLKLWCQFFNVIADSTIKWLRDEEEILEVKRSAGDETQVALAIVLASSHDCGVYGCTINNEYGTDTTDFLLSVDILSDILLREDLEVGEEIEMTPLMFTKGLANSGNWGDKYFGRIMTEMANIGDGCGHKASRVKVIYGLNPVFESGNTCIIKVQNPIAYGTKQECNLTDRNMEITKQECKIQNMIREYCKIFAAEARAIENFGSSLEVIPRYLMYRPANSVPYCTVEADLKGVFLRYCMTDPKGRPIAQTVSEMEQKCCSLQHWIHQWTHGNLLITRMEGVENQITNVRVVTKTKGYQGLTDSSSPDVFEHFLTVHQCNYYCGLLGLRPLKTADSLQQSAKTKSSRSPLLNRKLTPGSGSPQLQRKGLSPQTARKANSSPKVPRKMEGSDSNDKVKIVETTDVLEMR
ncbi:titin [Entelurus aequoreus]|uniref:titin n=1 Tax=Entelurus aequoreus TaxID=161455 RepID=UPI002B1D89A5|nr:titin [Entelurus aequoreus]